MSTSKLINRFKVYSLFVNAEFYNAVFILYLLHQGIDIQTIILIQSLYYATSVCMEIPSGIAADMIGKKAMVLTGIVILLASAICYSLGGHVWTFIIAAILQGVGGASISGADKALLYEALEERGETDRYINASSAMSAVGLTSLSIATLAGGFMADGWFPSIYLAYAFVLCIALTRIAALPTLKPQTPVLSPQNTRQSFRDLMRGFVSIHPHIWMIILTVSMVEASVLVFFVLSQTFLNSIGLGMAMIGVVFFGVELAGAGSSTLVPCFSKILSRFIRMAVVPLVMAAGMMISLFEELTSTIVTLILVCSIGTAYRIAAENDIQHLVSPEVRSTVLSSFSLGISLFTSMLFGLVSMLIPMIGDNGYLLVTGAICTLGGILAAITYRVGFSQKNE